MTISFPNGKGLKLNYGFIPELSREEKVAAKLEDGLSRDIIEPVTGISAWIKENGNVRLCVRKLPVTDI